MNDTDPCPCGSGALLSVCCKPIIDGKAKAATAAALMRSRYTAYTLQDIRYLASTLDANELRDFDGEGSAKWARDSTWLGLEIITTTAGGPDDTDGTVEFKARYIRKGVKQEHHEISDFHKTDGTWLYSGGREVPPEQFRREAPKLGRNEPCSCGSGKKYKMCCGK